MTVLCSTTTASSQLLGIFEASRRQPLEVLSSNPLLHCNHASNTPAELHHSLVPRTATMVIQ